MAYLRALYEDDTVSVSFMAANDQTRDLQPYIAEDDLMKVGGRLEKSDLPQDAKHPIICLASCFFSSVAEWLKRRNATLDW